MDAKYNPKDIEAKWYQYWQDKKLFHSTPDGREAYTVVIPPPNVTGVLHMGHVLNNTIQDILVRRARLEGKNACWAPGTDHASIATEAKVVKKLAEQGIKKSDLTREEFLKHAWEWTDEHGGIILKQLRKLGASCDWDRTAFTMDEKRSQSVIKVFVDLYNKGLIYRGLRMVNWDPKAQTALSNEEVIYKEEKSKLYYLKYYVVGLENVEAEEGMVIHKDDKGYYAVVATTRPETIMGDTAMCINPKDPKNTWLKGQKVIVPLVGREIPVIEDRYVDIEFGTGCLKVTPAHDTNDYMLGKKHNLETIDIFNPDGTLSQEAGMYVGMDRVEVRKLIAKDLETAGLLEKVEDYDNKVGYSERNADTAVEPRLCMQWFLRMQHFADIALPPVMNDELKFYPTKYKTTYNNWLENIQDWCISRQLWWGHRIPVWDCDDCGEATLCIDGEPKCCEHCHSEKIHQDPDTLDTWFSSALWPFSTMGWPEETPEYNYFYPTNVLVTGYDIITFWVSRMIFSGLEYTGKAPFDTVLIHGLVRDAQGRKMSKSLGNGIDPLEIIDNYGADALRFMLATGNSPGNDMRFYMERVEAARNFANKLWNASRFVFMNIDEEIMNGVTRESVEANMTLADKWIISRANNVVKEVTDNMDKFDLGIAAQKIYDFAWSEYCDWYIEIVKPRLYSDDKAAKQTALYTLTYVLEKILKLLHPYMPFITEEIYTHLPTVEGSIVIAEFPHYNEADNMAKEEAMMNLTMDGIRNIRNVRAEMNVPPSKKAKVIIVPTAEKKEAMEAGKDYFVTLASASVVEIVADETNIPEDAVSVVIEGVKIFIPLDELVDFTKELERLNKEKAKLEGEIKRVNGKLSNQGFLAKAPESLVNEEKAKKAKFEEMMNSVVERIANIESKMK